MNRQQPIILFDGNCMLCNNFVQFVLKHDCEKYLFVSSHSLTGKEICLEYNLPQTVDIDTIYLLENNKITSKSKAVLAIISQCGILFKLVSICFYFIPPFIRDYFYDLIAKNRHKIIKTKCSLLDSKNRNRVILT